VRRMRRKTKRQLELEASPPSWSALLWATTEVLAELLVILTIVANNKRTLVPDRHSFKPLLIRGTHDARCVATQISRAKLSLWIPGFNFLKRFLVSTFPEIDNYPIRKRYGN
jgi:hypothetical protein